jgi:hypothetical protein
MSSATSGRRSVAGHSTAVSTVIKRSLMGPYRAPAMKDIPDGFGMNEGGAEGRCELERSPLLVVGRGEVEGGEEFA